MAYNDDCNNYKSTSFCSASHHNMNINNHPFGTNRNFCMIVIYYYYSFQIAFSESGVRYRYYNSDSKSWIIYLIIIPSTISILRIMQA